MGYDSKKNSDFRKSYDQKTSFKTKIATIETDFNSMVATSVLKNELFFSQSNLFLANQVYRHVPSFLMFAREKETTTRFELGLKISDIQKPPQPIMPWISRPPPPCAQQTREDNRKKF